MHSKSHLCSCGLLGNYRIRLHLQWRQSCLQSFRYVYQTRLLIPLNISPNASFHQQYIADNFTCWFIVRFLELAYQLSNTAAKAILAHPNVLSSVLVAADASGVPKGRIFQFSDEAALERDGVKDWTSMVGSSEEGKTWNWPVLGLGEAATQVIATINYSSGTTGLPKGVCISHANLIANCEQSQFMRYVNTQYSSSNKPPQERWLGFLPLYHAYGQLYTILMAIKMQNPIYVMSEFTFEQFLNAIQQYKITSLQVVPPILKMLTQRAETEQYNLASITGIICGAAPLPHDLQNECRRKFGVNVRQGWGMTELTCTGIATPFSDNIYVGSVGSLIPNCECKLVDDDGREVDAGSHGELCIKGPNVCSGYWMNKEATQKTILEGWLKTGDIAVRNKEGLFWIVDRKKVGLALPRQAWSLRNCMGANIRVNRNLSKLTASKWLLQNSKRFS